MTSPISTSAPMGVGIIGCGNIFPAYIKGCALFNILQVKACADLVSEASRARAGEFGIASVSVDGILADPNIDIIINLTIPSVHAETSMKALKAGKHVYSEKPLAVDLAGGKAVCDMAQKAGLRVGCAPDTFLGAGLQTSRKVIEDGWIGRPVAGTAFMLSGGPESWHPNPAFFYKRGAGPLFDMGPYYITALVHLLGPVKSVSAMTARARSERLATCKEHFGEMLPVEVATHNSGSLLFESGAVISLSVSFDVHRHKHTPIEIYGTAGSLSVPDPNTFGGPVELIRAGEKEWTKMPLAFGYHENSRGLGVADMASGIRSGRPHRCDAALALHVLEVMTAFDKSHASRSWVDIENRCAQPVIFPLGMLAGRLDE